MEKISQKIGENLEYVKIIIDNKLELAKLDLSEKIGRLGGLLILWILMGGLLLSVFFFIGLGVGYYLSAVTGSYFIGFSCIGGFFLVLSLTLYLLRYKLILNPLYTFIAELIGEYSDQ